MYSVHGYTGVGQEGEQVHALYIYRKRGYALTNNDDGSLVIIIYHIINIIISGS